MSTTDRRYDVAISFLHRDEPLALQIHARLSESFDVFVYPKKQEELAGTDGMESFRQAFRSDSRLVVVLYRNGWGQTRWTRIEEEAIKDRAYNEGWDWLLFVKLGRESEIPKWSVETRIWLDFDSYGLDQLLGAIKRQAENLGSTPRSETAMDKAVRLEQENLARAGRDRLLREEGGGAVSKEHKKLLEVLDNSIEQLNAKLTTLKIEHGIEHGYLLRTHDVSINFYLHVTQPITDSRIVIKEWMGSLILPQDRQIYSRQPQVLAEKKFYFDYQTAYGWCWHSSPTSKTFLSTTNLAEHLIKRLLDLHGKFERGEIKWHEPKLPSPYIGQWS